jgi:hypothetical protein
MTPDLLYDDERLFEQLTSSWCLKLGFNDVKKNGEAPGVDGITICILGFQCLNFSANFCIWSVFNTEAALRTSTEHNIYIHHAHQLRLLTSRESLTSKPAAFGQQPTLAPRKYWRQTLSKYASTVNMGVNMGVQFVTFCD